MIAIQMLSMGEDELDAYMISEALQDQMLNK